MMNENKEVHFEYLFEKVVAGEVVDSWKETNIVPTEGLNHIINTVLNGGAQVSTWYLGLYEGNYTPVAGDTMATFPGLATETTAYTASTRLAGVFSAAAGGVSDNSASKAEFEFNASKTIYGGFISSVATKSSTSGTLLSAVKFTTSKAMESGATLRVTAGLTLTSS